MTGPARFRNGALTVLLAATVVTVLCWAFIPAERDRIRPVSASMSFQVLCWGASILIIARRRAVDAARMSSPGLLILIFCGLFLIYPSVEWCHSRILPYAREDIDAETANFLFWAHGLFMLSFAVVYTICAGKPKKRDRLLIDWRKMQSPWLWYLLPMLPLAIEIIVRLLSGRSILPEESYSDRWTGLQGRVAEARFAGGLGYLVEQIYSKLEFYVIITQGIGGGLLLVWATGRNRQFRMLVFICAMTGLQLVLTAGARSPIFISLLTCLAFADFIVGLEWRRVTPILLAGLAMFEFFGYYRLFSEGSAMERLESTFAYIASPQESGISPEFGAMLPKEAVSIELFADSKEGFFYFVRSFLGVVPSQILPQKTNWQSTSFILSNKMIPILAAEGGGVAGTSVGDGYRFFGITGIIISAGLFGILFGRLYDWANHEIKPGVRGPILLKAALLSGLCGLTYNVLRSGLDEVFMFFCYYVIFPWLLATFLRRSSVIWVRPLPVLRRRSMAVNNGLRSDPPVAAAFR